jgi:thiol-disulfide isomerase/thioredoxin
MKKICFRLLIFLVLVSACATKKPVVSVAPASEPVQAAEVDFSKQVTWLLGYFNPVQFAREPHSSWYIKGFDSYMPETEAINKLININKESLTIKIVMGTWCPDSRREVPRFMRILELWQFPASLITFIGVDDEKQSPVGEYGELDIQRVPTFIIYKNNVESGRIIENPETSLEQDMVNILTRNE